jgi:hypothetical protein
VTSLRIRIAVALAITATAQSGCDRGPQFGPPDNIIRLGNGQTTQVATAVDIEPAILVEDADGRGVPGIQVIFKVTSGDGNVSNPAAVTDKKGRAGAGKWTVGPIAGENILVASAAGVPDSPVTFTASGVAGPAVSLVKLADDPVAAPAGGHVDSIAVRAEDAFRNPVPNVRVLFTVTSGGGSVSPTSRVTLADGRAGARWTLGPEVDATNTAKATLEDGSLAVIFSTRASRPIAAIRISPHVFVVDSASSATPQIQAVDQSGAIVAGANVSLISRDPTVASAGGSSVAGVRTGQTFIVASAIEDPSVRDSALVIVGNADAPVVSIAMPRFDLKGDTTFTVPLTIDMRSSTEKLGAATLVVSWDPALLTLVSQVATSVSAAVEVNTASTASGRLTIAIASGAGLSAASDIRSLTFKAAATSGRTGLVNVSVIDMSTAGSFTNLVPRTVSGSYPLRIR